MLYVPAPSVSSMAALPEEVSCALPRIALPAQRAAVASQNKTVPGATGAPPLATVAVSVAAAPAAMDAPGRMVSVVVVESAETAMVVVLLLARNTLLTPGWLAAMVC